MSNVFTQPSPPVLAIEGGVATITLNRPAQRNKLENGDLQLLLEPVSYTHLTLPTNREV